MAKDSTVTLSAGLDHSFEQKQLDQILISGTTKLCDHLYLGSKTSWNPLTSHLPRTDFGLFRGQQVTLYRTYGTSFKVKDILGQLVLQHSAWLKQLENEIQWAYFASLNIQTNQYKAGLVFGNYNNRLKADSDGSIAYRMETTNPFNQVNLSFLAKTNVFNNPAGVKFGIAISCFTN